MCDSSPALCILTRKYNETWISFLAQFSDHYTIYMVIDEAPEKFQSIPVIRTSVDFPNVHLIQINDDECKTNNYYGSSVASNLKEIVAWDKALYFFNRVNQTKHSYVWFLEDDVFLYEERILRDIDREYPKSDLLSSFHEINPNGDIYRGWNHWVNVIHKIGTPWAHSLVCCTRISEKLLKCVDVYRVDRPLLFVESLFNTLALHHHLIVDTPTELSCITYNETWDASNICDKNKIYHPVKNMDLHSRIRQFTEKFPE